MRLSLTHRSRSLLLFLSAAGYVAWFAGLDDRIDAADAPLSTFAAERFAESVPKPSSLMIVRDPFAGTPTPSRAGVPIRDVMGQVSNALSVPDIAINANDGQASAQYVVRATIVGADSVAYVDNGPNMNLVRVGDSLGNERVVAIDLGGVAFADGTRLDLPGASKLEPAPPTSGPSLSRQLAQIRSLLLHDRVSAARAAQVTASTPTPTATEAVTPAPLQTADSQGLPVGVNPTPDLAGPTAFPYPYPYPPPARP